MLWPISSSKLVKRRHLQTTCRHTLDILKFPSRVPLFENGKFKLFFHGFMINLFYIEIINITKIRPLLNNKIWHPVSLDYSIPLLPGNVKNHAHHPEIGRSTSKEMCLRAAFCLDLFCQNTEKNFKSPPTAGLRFHVILGCFLKLWKAVLSNPRMRFVVVTYSERLRTSRHSSRFLINSL